MVKACDLCKKIFSLERILFFHSLFMVTLFLSIQKEKRPLKKKVEVD